VKKAAVKQAKIPWGEHPIKARCKSVGLTVCKLAKLIPCSRVAIYEAHDRPARFPRVARRMEELLNA